MPRSRLKSRQRAVIALDVLDILKEEARERQLAQLRQGDKTPVQEKFPERENGRAADKAALELKKEGRTQAEVGALLGVDQRTVGRWLQDENTSNRHVPNASNDAQPEALDRRIKLTPDDKKEIVERIEAGETQAQVAALNPVRGKTCLPARESFNIPPGDCDDAPPLARGTNPRRRRLPSSAVWCARRLHRASPDPTPRG